MRLTLPSILIATVLSWNLNGSLAWSSTGIQQAAFSHKALHHAATVPFTVQKSQQHSRMNGFQLRSSTESAEASTNLSDDEWNIIQQLYEKAASSSETLEQLILEALPTIEPAFIMKLRQPDLDARKEFKAVSSALDAALDARFNGARDILQDLLGAGEIRKLDSLIGKNAREGKLDVAFFQVLNMNLQDASKASSEGDDDALQNAGTNRFQILQHIYTRCQEEVEKTIPEGVALLNKLLRTEQKSIRSNQLNHYLCPQATVIKSPDGKEIDLGGEGKILVPHTDFVDAIGNAIKQIRTIEKAGGATQEVTAGLVESCRMIAKEARIAIGEHFGVESDELKAFEEALMPMFRPSSPESPYIQGE